LIKWLAAPINPADLNIIEGMYGVKANLPAIGGTEGAGVIVETGKDVKGVNVFDHVIPAKATGFISFPYFISTCTA
jgi:trans-2-enoyl-CoA reductase